jgi:putative ABC transport system permease protein
LSTAAIASLRGGNTQVFAVIMGLIGTLTLLLAAVAGLGVLNTVVLQTRERVHDLGVFKAIGMTPRQTMAMVASSVLDVYHAPQLILLALAGLAIAVAGAMLPAGWAAKTRTAFALRAE